MELEPQTHIPRAPSWALVHIAGLVCAGIGLLTLSATAYVHFGAGHGLSELPPLWLTVPGLVLALAAGITSLVRREGVRVLPLTGTALAASAMIIGIALILWVIAFVAFGVILILSEVM